MSGSALFLAAFAAVVVMILVTVWAAMVLEAGARPPRRAPEAARPGDEPGEPKAAGRKAARAFSTPPPLPLPGRSTPTD